MTYDIDCPQCEGCGTIAFTNEAPFAFVFTRKREIRARQIANKKAIKLAHQYLAENGHDSRFYKTMAQIRIHRMEISRFRQELEIHRNGFHAECVACRGVGTTEEVRRAS